MNPVLYKSIDTSYSCEDFNKTKQDPIKIFPDELVLNVFSHLNLAALGTICCVCKAWKRLANEPNLWKIAVYRELAFGNDKWAQCFGPDVVKNEDKREEFSSLPLADFIADCKKFTSIFTKRKAKDNLMLVRLPKTLNGKLTLKSLGELAKSFWNSESGYRFIPPAIVQQLGDKSIDKSYWVLMTKDVLPGSRAKTYFEQQKMVADLAEKSLISYEMPETLESAACILSQYFDSNIGVFSDNPWTYTRCKDRVFSDNPWTYTRCKDKVQGNPTFLGGVAPTGLGFDCTDYNSPSIGVAALRKF